MLQHYGDLTCISYVWLEPLLSWRDDPESVELVDRVSFSTDDIWVPNLDMLEATADEGGGYDSQV